MGDKIGLLTHFKNKVEHMLLSVDRGKVLHQSGNIKESGALLESDFRQLLEESLPTTLRVTSGYFYGANSQCSNEVDVLICENSEAFRLNLGSKDQQYVPYTSVAIFGQIKNSASDLSKAIQQVHTSLQCWENMRQHANLSHLKNASSSKLSEPLSFIVCGRCSDTVYKKLSKIIRDTESKVAYILLLDRGEIIAGCCDLFTSDLPTVGFADHNTSHSQYLCKPNTNGTINIGAGLLWLYFALVSNINGSDLRYKEFCAQVERLYPLHAVKKLT